jgi:excinuclease ABC subunit A
VEIGEGLTVVTGVSGSGKTSLVFDTIYHEAHRRFLDIYTLGSSAMRLAPASVRVITGLGPAVAVGQNLLNRNPNSTLATAVGLHPFLRLLYANFGERRCPECGASLTVLTEDEMVERLASLARQSEVRVLAPIARSAPGSHRTLLEALAKEFGPEALIVDGRPWQPQPLDPAAPHDIAVQVAQLAGALAVDVIRQAVRTVDLLGAQALTVRAKDGELTMSRAPACAQCGTWFGDLRPLHFHLPCPHCSGEGCPRCGHTGLHPLAATVRWHGLRLTELLALPVDQVQPLFAESELPPSASRLRTEIARRLDALETVGLGYITLDRPAPTLSRGEAQRVRLAVALTSRLEDMLHVLDEPTVGQHPADVARLLPAFRRLGGPVLYVEHDRGAVAVADQAIDLGPGAGDEGGRVLFSGTPAGLWEADTPTGRYFSWRERVRHPALRPDPERFLVVRGASLRNLQDIDVRIPIGRLTVVTGVSGSGKSTLVEDVLVATLTRGKPAGCRAIEGPMLKPIMVDQSPIGLNPRSNPATYTKLADIIRDCFALSTGLSPSRFSFNRPEGACPACKGMGAVEVQMRYLPSTWIPCADCGGQRFSDEVLAARAAFHGRMLSIADFYLLSVSEVIPLLMAEGRLPQESRQAAQRILEALRDVGLGYLPLGQPSPTLSGGEAQRVKLARYLGRKSLAQQLLVLDEPSTGLHPQDVAGLLAVLDRLVRSGATVIIVEHNSDIMRTADWIVDLGPGSGPSGGRLLYAGPADRITDAEGSATGRALREEAQLRPTSRREPSPQSTSPPIAIRGARAHNLQNVDVDFPKGALTVVTGVSGSGKSSLVADVLETEARRRFLETLSLYERQGTREGPEAPVESVTGLGVAITVGSERRLHDRRASVGTATELSHHLAVLLSRLGERRCHRCGAAMARGREWRCPACQDTASLAEPRHFSGTTYSAACPKCNGVGTLQVPRPEKLIRHPEKPLCDGAMYSPGFFPNGYLRKPFNGGYDLLQALGRHLGFDPATTPWNEMSPEAQRIFLFGDPKPITVAFCSRTGRTGTRMGTFPGFYGWVRDWDVGGTYTATEPCPVCHGARLRPEYLAVTLAEHNMHSLSEMPLASPRSQPGASLARVLEDVPIPTTETDLAGASLRVARARLHFLKQVGLGYLHLNRPASTLSAGEAQRVRLAGLLGSGLTSLTVLLDEPSRGLHPSEVNALLGALQELRDEGNTVIVVEHDPLIMRSADNLVDVGPGAGAEGGRIVAQGRPDEVMRANTLTGRWLRGERRLRLHQSRRQARGWFTIHGARANNLRGEEVRLPLGVFVGVCGVSGSGKSTLIVDTLGRALAPKKHTTSVALEPVDPGEHDAIEGAPSRTVIVDQTRAGVRSPADFLDLSRPLRALYAASEDAQALGLDEKQLARGCSTCGGSGANRIDMGFLPDVYEPCETCQGTGYLPEVWQVCLHGLALPELFSRTIDEVHRLLEGEVSIARILTSARDVGLGYLVLRQPGFALSAGEAQRLKIAKELSREVYEETLYILDEPTVGQHLEDVARLSEVLHRLVEARHTVLVVEHHPHLLASCDWLVELGPGGGPDGGRVVAEGTPETVAAGATPTAPYLRQVLEEGQ